MFNKLQAKKRQLLLLAIPLLIILLGATYFFILTNADQKAARYTSEVNNYLSTIKQADGDALTKTLKAQPKLENAMLGTISSNYKKAETVKAVVEKSTALLSEMNSYEAKKINMGYRSFYSLSAVTLKTESQRTSMRNEIMSDIASLTDGQLKERYIKFQENELAGATEYKNVLATLTPETSYHKLVVNLMKQRNQELIDNVTKTKKRYAEASEKDFLNNIDGAAKIVDESWFDASVAQAALVNSDEMLLMKSFKPALLKQTEVHIKNAGSHDISTERLLLGVETSTYLLLSKSFLPKTPSQDATTDTTKIWPLHGVNDAAILLTKSSKLSSAEKTAKIKLLEENALAYKLLVQSGPSTQRSYLADFKDLLKPTSEDDTLMKSESSSAKALAAIPEQRLKKLQTLTVHPYIKSDIEALTTYSQEYKAKISSAKDALDAMYLAADYQDGLQEKVLKISDKLDKYDEVTKQINQTIDRSL